MTAGSKGDEVFDLDADGQAAAALRALQDAGWRLRLVVYRLEEEYRLLEVDTYQPSELGACMAIAGLLAQQIDTIGTQARRLRKRARNI